MLQVVKEFPLGLGSWIRKGDIHLGITDEWSLPDRMREGNT